ncbi:MAG: LssY C-terminal domain-containing protein [Candidatus Acidiferrum sp.]
MPSKNQSPQPASTAVSPTTELLLTQEIQLTGDQLWVDTTIDLHPGERLIFSATGSLRYPDAKSENSPGGLPRNFKDLLRVFPDNDAGRGALIARIGDSNIADPFLVGTKRDLIVPAAGRLSIGINQTSDDTADGTYTVEIAIYAPDPASSFVTSRSVPSLTGIDNSLFARIPRRVSDKSGAPGDMVNFLILGTQSAMERAFKSAGWVRVDSDVKDSVLAGVMASISKESYLTLPMSQLFLFDRSQDYGWAHAEPIKVVASRHHLRLWKSPFTVKGQTLWVGAATHDVGFAHDDRSKDLTAITHKIDPAIDQERDYVEKNLSATGQVAEVTHFLPENPVQSAKTATGGSFHSNGQVLILQLAPPH